MSSLIYFPGFEPCDQNWLKFAMLYLDKVEPIVPLSADIKLTDTFRELLEYTDFISLYRPNHGEGERATADAIEQVEKILRHPKLYKQTFGTDRIDELWRSADQPLVEIWHEKFSSSWRDFRIVNNFGRDASNGIAIPQSLADVYMTILANCIADQRGVSSISDTE